MSVCAKVESSAWKMYLCNLLLESGFCFEFLSMRFWALFLFFFFFFFFVLYIFIL